MVTELGGQVGVGTGVAGARPSNNGNRTWCSSWSGIWRGRGPALKQRSRCTHLDVDGQHHLLVLAVMTGNSIHGLRYKLQHKVQIDFIFLSTHTHTHTHTYCIHVQSAYTAPLYGAKCCQAQYTAPLYGAKCCQAQYTAQSRVAASPHTHTCIHSTLEPCTT